MSRVIEWRGAARCISHHCCVTGGSTQMLPTTGADSQAPADGPTGLGLGASPAVVGRVLDTPSKCLAMGSWAQRASPATVIHIRSAGLPFLGWETWAAGRGR